MSALPGLPHRMTVPDFHAWRPPDELADRRWELVDGEPVCMAPPSQTHALIQNETGRLIGNHLALHRPDCRVASAPGVIPRARAAMNERVPDLGVSCSGDRAAYALPDPVLLIEILSPSNEHRTRANVWAYTSIPSVCEILLISSVRIGAELLRRGADREWPAAPEFLDAEAVLSLQSIGLTVPLRALYRTTGLIP